MKKDKFMTFMEMCYRKIPANFFKIIFRIYYLYAVHFLVGKSWFSYKNPALNKKCLALFMNVFRQYKNMK